MAWVEQCLRHYYVFPPTSSKNYYFSDVVGGQRFTAAGVRLFVRRNLFLVWGCDTSGTQSDRIGGQLLTRIPHLPLLYRRNI